MSLIVMICIYRFVFTRYLIYRIKEMLTSFTHSPHHQSNYNHQIH
ncbi:hypothetical protein PROSTU_00836 [Providencia stuartii ATCC 25827]|uniref:Uncharacterized protein n=1 Tax=Providencia stuartii ATCC 25827 TaxID=471874 RepID=A0AA86YNR7_PROST|nr:hypothetical protein PROSTU_00836 [Providencia stuartii ATCC 25827]